MPNPLEIEFKYFVDHRDELVTHYEGKTLVIKNGQVLGAYNSDSAAFTETIKEHEIGTFLVQKCEPGSDYYAQVFNSGVSFSHK